ncbi:MAG: SUMF1/EgtB/PvdO family nonheme iron enzyme [Pirellulales bacterium]|nr:SUMF1/EgtB/PvdO family nonheme iron enzyme [Pirellulales bacterium]
MAWLFCACAQPVRAEETLTQSCDKLRAVIVDLTGTFGDRYPNGQKYIQELDRLQPRVEDRDPTAIKELEKLRREALLANPLLTDLPGVLVVKRKPRGKGVGREIAMPSNHECNASLNRGGYDDSICRIDPQSPAEQLKTVYRPEDKRYVGELDLHFDADRLLFTQSDEKNWKIMEMAVDGSGVRQVSRMPDDVDCMDACYLPNGRIVFGSTASYQSVPCWHGRRRVSNLYLMNGDGTGVRQLCFDQDHNFNPTVMNNGRLLYHRWDYTGICHIFLRQLMTMNPDGTKQRAIYGSNSWYPNSLFFPQVLPGTSSKIICILSGYHGVHRMGRLVVLDTGVGWQGSDGIIKRISGRGDPIKPAVKDALIDVSREGDWPLFLHPYPLSDKYYLVSGKMDPDADWAIYVCDIYDNLVLFRNEPRYALLEPVPIMPREHPPMIPDQTDMTSDEASVYVNDVYAGPGLKGVPRGTAKSLRIIGYHFGYPGLAGSDKIGYGGPWEVMRILGTVRLDDDGSASFKIPANTPVAIQVLDKEGKAIQLMRSWMTAMPGERVSCAGCHESPNEAVSVGYAKAAICPPRELTPWYGPARGFDFEREVQPVLDKYCVGCHNGEDPAVADLRSAKDGAQLTSHAIGYVARLHPKMLADTKGRLTYTPAYDVLVHYIRRVGVEDDVDLLTPGEYHADTSPLVQMLEDGRHHNVKLDREAWDRIVTWIDMNGPCHGSWNDVYPVPDGAHERRMELAGLYGGPKLDPEILPANSFAFLGQPLMPEPLPRSKPLDFKQESNTAGSLETKSVDLGKGVSMQLMRIPAGRFVMGDAGGLPGEYPERVVEIERPFWIGRCEVTNRQYRRYEPSHDSHYYCKRRDRADGKGLSLNEDNQPVVYVSYEEALDFCRWMSRKTGLKVTLPNETQWEYACRAGARTSLFFGDVGDDFSKYSNLADKTFSTGVMDARGRAMPEGGVTQATGGVPHLLLEGAKLADTRYDDKHRVTAPVGSYLPNNWGLCDMTGNAAEWTTSDHHGEKIFRGGSFFDPPKRARSSLRSNYPGWQRLFNVGFRVLVEE